jgi:hypothetical protein
MSSTTKHNTRKLPTPTSTKSNPNHHVTTTNTSFNNNNNNNNNNVDTLRSRSYSTHTFTSLDEISHYNSTDNYILHNNSNSHYNDDPLGMHITDLLNAGVFQGIRKNSVQNDGKDGDLVVEKQEQEQKQKIDNIFPIVSIRNLKKVQNFLLVSYHIIFNQESKTTDFETKTETETATTKTIHQQIPKIHKIQTLPTVSQSFKISITFLLLSSILISSFTNIILQSMILIYLVLLLFLSSLVIDYNDLYNTLFPVWIQHNVVNGVKDYVEQIGINYFYTQRYLGRNQWIVSNNDKEEEENIHDGHNHAHDGYQFLIHRNAPCAITKSKMKCTITTKNNNEYYQNPILGLTTTTTSNYIHTNNNSINNHTHTPMWQCQNVNWDKLSSILQNQHNKNHDQKYVLHPSSLDHLIATNYCYIMINGNNNDSKHSVANKKGSKRKLHSHRHTNRRKGLTITTTTAGTTSTNNYHSDGDNLHIYHRNAKSDDHHLIPLSPILSSQSEDFYDPKNGSGSGGGPHTPSHHHQHVGGLTSVQSVDAIEIIRPSSIQRHDIVNHKMPSSPTLEKRSKRRSHATKNRDLIQRGLGGKSDEEEEEEDVKANQHVLDADLTLDPSEEVLLSDIDAINSDGDVSFSSTSYGDVDENPPGTAIRNCKDETNKDDVKWLDVGAKIGRRILESEKLHQVITQSQMGTNISSSFSGAEDEIELKKKDPFDYTQAESPKNIAKPFHAMWTSPNVEYPSFDDAASEDYSNSVETSGEPSTQGDDKMTKPRSITRRNSICSLSPKSKMSKRLAKPLRGYGHGRSISLPTSPIRSRSVASRLSEANTSLSSSEAFQLAPKQFDANRYLPPSMAIHHNAAIDNIDLINKRDSRQTLKKLQLKTDSLPEFSNKFQLETPRVKNRRRQPLLAGVRMVVPIYPASYRKKVSHSPCYYQFATVISSKRINASSPPSKEEDSDCLSITVLLDKSFLRSGKFAEMTLRILDTQRHMPRLVIDL